MIEGVLRVHNAPNAVLYFRLPKAKFFPIFPHQKFVVGCCFEKSGTHLATRSQIYLIVVHNGAWKIVCGFCT